LDIASSHRVLMTIGITPTRPETGYGYIQVSENCKEPDVHRGIKFVEKPDYQQAVEYLNSGNFLWNSGIFAWKISVILEKIQEFLPELYKGLEELDRCSDIHKLKASLERVFPSLPSISIDYGVMEQASDIIVLRGSFGWDDLGSWSSLGENIQGDKNGNIIEGNFVGVGVENSIISSSSGIIAAIGVKDIIIVEADGAILVCHLSQAQKVKEITEKLKQNGETKYL
ncbi:MAG TPA: sugar phosphate nucleotidyltransferase, partial [Halanaerobiales bacterium]|nr:sugar phosphate nucleotidyltransferase [Halanaerobiales bacterium]